jgi:microcystin-dependent protein
MSGILASYADTTFVTTIDTVVFTTALTTLTSTSQFGPVHPVPQSRSYTVNQVKQPGTSFLPGNTITMVSGIYTMSGPLTSYNSNILTINLTYTSWGGPLVLDGGGSYSGTWSFTSNGFSSLAQDNSWLIDALRTTPATSLFITGMIIAFNSVNAPSGWALCDGQGGRPDLRGRFILGTGSGSGLTTRNLSDSSGNESHQLTVNQIPAHQHALNPIPDFNNSFIFSAGSNRNGLHSPNLASGYTTTLGSGSGTTLGNAHPIMPPFYVLTYIIKL